MPASPSTGVRRASILTLEVGAVGLAAVAIAFVVLQLWRAELRVPFVYNGDGVFNSMLVKGIVENGWFLHNPHLGFPFGQNLLDYPQGADNLHFLAMRVLSLGSRDPGVVMNVFYIGTYFVNAASAYLALRLMRRTRATAVVFAILFAFLPYHVFRGENHIFLSGYEGIPLAGLLLYWVFQPRPIFFDAAGWRLWRSRRALASILIALALGATGAYYGVFAALPLGLAAVVGLAAGWGWRRSLSALALSALIAFSLVANLAPSIVHRFVHGTNLEATHKEPLASEFFGLKIAQLVLPVQEHRIDRLAAFQKRSYNPTLPSEGAQQLGTVGAIGFVGLIGWGLARMARRDPVGADAEVGPLAFGTLVMVLCGTIGGFSVVLALLGLTEIRSWNRVSVMIAFFAFAFVALGIERGAEWLTDRRPAVMRGGVTLAVALPILLIGALIDETTSAALPNYAASSTAFVRDRAFVQRVEASLAQRGRGVPDALHPVPRVSAAGRDGRLRPHPRLPPLPRPEVELRRGQRSARGLAGQRAGIARRAVDPRTPRRRVLGDLGRHRRVRGSRRGAGQPRSPPGWARRSRASGTGCSTFATHAGVPPMWGASRPPAMRSRIRLRSRIPSRGARPSSRTATSCAWRRSRPRSRWTTRSRGRAR